MEKRIIAGLLLISLGLHLFYALNKTPDERNGIDTRKALAERDSVIKLLRFDLQRTNDKLENLKVREGALERTIFETLPGHTSAIKQLQRIELERLKQWRFT